MAIQISGTTVINNSRQLQNIASADSTTQNTINGFVSGGDAFFPKGTNMSSIFDVSSVNLAAGTYFFKYANYVFSTRTLNLPTTNVTGGFSPYNTMTWGSGGWKQQLNNSSSNTAITSVSLVSSNLYGWFRCSGTTSVSLTGGPSQKFSYVKVD
jgi:hypothetical protein